MKLKDLEMLPTKTKTCCSREDDANVMCKLHRSKVRTPLYNEILEHQNKSEGL